MNHQKYVTIGAWCIGIVWMLTSSLVFAHLMPANRGTVNLVNDKAYMVLSLPVSTFHAALPAGVIKQGSITSKDLNTHQGALRRMLRKSVQLSSPSGSATFDTVLLNLPIGYGHDPKRGGELVVMASAKFQQAPRDISLSSALWTADSDPLKIQMTITKKGKTIKKEVATLSASAPRHVFFSTPSYVLRTTLKDGFVHMFIGTDHIVFLLLVLVLLGTTRRRIIGALVFASVAAMAMFYGAMGWPTPTAGWIELCIAASILVVMLLHMGNVLDVKFGALWIAGLAICHGWGFVQVQELGSHLPLIKTTGFALGVGLGVALITCAVLALHIPISSKLKDSHKQRALQIFLGVAFAIGLWWCVERVSGLMA